MDSKKFKLDFYDVFYHGVLLKDVEFFKDKNVWHFVAKKESSMVDSLVSDRACECKYRWHSRSGAVILKPWKSCVRDILCVERSLYEISQKSEKVSQESEKVKEI